MDLGAQSGLLAAIVTAAVAISVMLRGRRAAVNTLFIVFCGNLFVHFLAAFFHQFSGSTLWFRVDLVAASLLPVSSLLFFGYFLWKDPVVARPYVRTTYVVSGLLALFQLTPLSQTRFNTAAVVAYVFLILYLCAYLVYIRYGELKSQRERTRLRYLLVVMLVAVTFVLLGMLPGTLSFLHTWGDLVSIFYLYFLSQSLLIYRLLDFQELLGRGLILMAVALILAVVFGLLVVLAGGSMEVSFFQTFVASFVILILFEPLRDKLEGGTNLLFFRERTELRGKLEELRREVANIIDLKQMTNVILDTLYDSMRISDSSIYLQEEGGAGYYLAGYRGPEPAGRMDIAAHRAFFDQLRKTPTVVLAETFDRFLAEQGAPADSEPSEEVIHAQNVLKTLAHMNAGICIPLVGQNEVLGIWNIRDEPVAESYSTEEIARMMAVGEQAAINIENSKMFEKLRERDRLAVLGEMSAGLAHEIRNPLGAIKGAAQYLDPAAVGEDASEFLNIIIEETDRLNVVVDQFLDYARPYQAQHEPTDVNLVISQTVRLLAPGLQEKKIELSVDLQSDLPSVMANGQQLTQVFLNLMNNAQEAMPDGGQISIKTSLQSDGQGTLPRQMARQQAVRIQVSDNGPGIPPPVQERIFVPFFTTKARGTGLGLAISQRILEHHGGEIRIRSRAGEGSTFTIYLPAATTSGISATDEDQTAPDARDQTQDDLPFPSQHSREKP